MTRKRISNVDAPGQDSFLDIVANLVGILIILIMVIGVQATNAMVDAAPDDESVQPEDAIDVTAARSAAVAVEQDVHQIDSKIKRQELEIAYRRKERDKMFAYITAAEQELEQKRQELDDSQRKELEMHKTVLAARTEFEDLKASRQSLENSLTKTNVIQHLPTPMAKTVFGTELHFRLEHGRVTYVPWEQLVERLKSEAPSHVWKLKNASSTTETLGPIRDFRMKYTLRRARKTATNGTSVTVQSMIELDRFVLIPIRDNLGEPLDTALQETSQFHAVLENFDPDRTTVTVWVYPDSFAKFRRLKEDLFRRGYLTAGRPMPEGHPIGGSPQGSRSAAQ